MLPRLMQRSLALAAGAAVLFVSAVTSAATVSQQIIVDQFGWRASAPRKVVIFADPISGQNSAVAYTPGSSFQIRRVSDNATVFTGSVASWKSGTTHTQSGDKVWYGDFSSFTTAGDYYVFDPTNNLQSYNFKLDDAVYSNVLKASARTFYYQRCGTALSSTYGGNWNHTICHTGSSQDLAALQWLNGAATGTARNVSGGWHDAGDMNKYVPFTASTLWNLMMAYEWNTAAFPDNWGIPESGNGVPDILDEVKYELDWLLKMQMANGSVCNRVAVTQYVASSPPNVETIARYYTAPTSWATATAAAHFAHGARLFSAYSSRYPNYSTTLQTAATNAWNWLNSNPNMTPSNGTDNSGGMAAAGADCNANADKRLRVLAAAQLFKTTGNTTYRTYFDTWVKDPSTNDGTQNPLVNNWFDATAAADMNRACFIYATATNATASLVTEIKADLAATLDAYLGYYTNGDDAYRGQMWDGHYTWGSNSIKSEWGNLFIAGIKLNVNAANSNSYKEAAEEYLHYFHGRNPLSWCYLGNMGTKGANAGADKPVMENYHGWFCDGSSLYDGASSTYGQAPGYLSGGPNQYYSGTVTPPKGEPPMKAYKDWNNSSQSSWEVTEPAIYYQAAYSLLLSQFVAAGPAPVAAPSFSPAPGTYSSAQNVTITTSTSGASIRYTTDGSTPTSTTGTLYSGPVSITSTKTLKAIAYKSGMTDSSVTSGVYTISTQVAAPTFSPAAGTYTSAQSVTISTTTSGATIRYTTNGSTPTSTSGTVYSSPVSISATTTLKAIAYKSGMTDSTVTTGIYTINLPASLYIYQEAIAADWSDWSWSATNNLANTSPVKNGTKSISTTFTAGWAALSLDKGTAQSTSGYTSVRFWVHGGTTTRNLTFYTQTADSSGNSPSIAFTATANTWTEITVSMSSLGNPSVIKRINFQDSTGSAKPAMYVDDIRLVP